MHKIKNQSEIIIELVSLLRNNVINVIKKIIIQENVRKKDKMFKYLRVALNVD